MRTFYCTNCNHLVFFENVRCESCGSALGFVPFEMSMRAFSVRADGQWLPQPMQTAGAPSPSLATGTSSSPDQSARYKPCANYTGEAVCNWMLAADEELALCACCRYTAVIPALSKPDNKASWFQLEAAKRRLFYSMYALGLPVIGRDQDPQRGLVFQFLENQGPDKSVLTGHNDGVITMNIDEANDAKREAQRLRMREPYRTLLGHFRHEIGHYYWSQLVENTSWLEPFRATFGDERANYRAALERHYSSGPPADWPERFISAYASTHPWEDWAETWAHYMHLIDALETASHWKVALEVPGGNSRLKPVSMKGIAGDTGALRALLIEQWIPLSLFLNSMGRSLGQGDFYPFVLPGPVLDKLCFIHDVIGQRARARASAPALGDTLAPRSSQEVDEAANDRQPVGNEGAPVQAIEAHISTA